MLLAADRLHPLRLAVISYCVVYAVTVVSRYVQLASYAMYFIGIAFPLIWASLDKDWAATGFTRHNWRWALVLGSLAGVLLFTLIYSGLWLAGSRLLPALLPRQLLIGIPLSFLVISPFQEFLFRGWLQPRFQRALGNVFGLLVCAFLFGLWDALPPLQAAPIGRIGTTMATLILPSFGVGLVFGYLFHRTGNMLAPWLAHSLAALAVIAAGRLMLV